MPPKFDVKNVETIGTISHLSNIGTITNISGVSLIGTLTNIQNVGTINIQNYLGTLNAQNTLGTLNIINYIGTLNRLNNQGTVNIKLYGTNSQGIKADTITSSLSVILTPHAEIHAGNSYFISHIFGSVADNSTVNIQIAVGSNKSLHLAGDVAHGGDARIKFSEGATTTGGTAISIFNKNRTSANISDATISYNATSSSIGTIIQRVQTFGGEGNKTTGGIRSQANEWILNKDKKYLLSVVNQGGTTKTIGVNLEWYEEP